MDIRIEQYSTQSWQNLVQDAASKCNSNITEDLESYLVFLLIRFTKDTQLSNSVLALEYLETQSLTGVNKQQHLQSVGDKCLLLAGFYPEQAHKRLVSLEYFVNLGRGAYFDIATTNYKTTEYQGLNKLFGELANNFVILLDILHQIKLLDKTQEWLLDEITKFEKNKLKDKNKIITINTKLNFH